MVSSHPQPSHKFTLLQREILSLLDQADEVLDLEELGAFVDMLNDEITQFESNLWQRALAAARAQDA